MLFRSALRSTAVCGFLLTVVACIFDANPQGGWERPTSSSSSSPQSSSTGSALDSLAHVLDSLRQLRAAERDSLRALSSAASSSSSSAAPSIDTLPTWAVPFTQSVSLVQFNPVGRPADPVLSGLGHQRPATLLGPALWEQMFPRRAGVHHLCDEDTDFYTLGAFLEAAQDFPAFAAEGPDAVRRRELAAFLAQIAHETSGGAGSYDSGSDRYLWGLCWTTEIGYHDLSGAYRQNHPIWPPSPNKSYHGRGPIQLTWNYNYGAAGEDLALPLLAQPELVLATGANAFRTALWFWMKEQSPKPAAHSAMVETWAPSPADKRRNRWPGFGVTTNIINGGGECGIGSEGRNGPRSRMGYFDRFLAMLQTTSGRNVSCTEQRDFTFQ